MELPKTKVGFIALSISGRLFMLLMKGNFVITACTLQTTLHGGNGSKEFYEDFVKAKFEELPTGNEF